MDVIGAYRDVGSYRGAAEICGTTHKTVKRIIEAHEAGQRPGRKGRPRNFEGVADLVAERVKATAGRVSAKRLLPQARAAGYNGSARNFRRLVARVKAEWRQSQHRGRRPGVWAPGGTLIIDWGVDAGLHVFCAVSAWSRFRFIRFAADEKAGTTFALLAECFETLGGVPGTVLADRMGCLKGGVVANVVVPTPEYVRFATYYRFRPDFCEAADPESKGMVEHLVGYAKRDLIVRRHRSMISPRPMPQAPRGARRSTPLSIPRFVRFRSTGWPSSIPCFDRCRRCGLSWVPDPRPERSTGYRLSASARPATRCRAD